VSNTRAGTLTIVTREPLNLFVTCLINEFAPETGFAVVRVLEHLGYTVTVPTGQTCCGQPAFNSGFHDAARTAAQHTIEIMERTTGPIVVPSGSCGDMIAHQFHMLFERDDSWRARAQDVAARAIEFSAFVGRHLEGLTATALHAKVAYHPSCHLARGLGVDREPRAVLDAIAGVEQAEFTAPDECCGFGGLFAVKHADISTRLLERKLAHLSASGAERVVSCDLGCLLHIGGGLHRRGAAMKVQHLADLIAEALR
jgi:L-lactate dehydrogenase complex protein LldE